MKDCILTLGLNTKDYTLYLNVNIYVNLISTAKVKVKAKVSHILLFVSAITCLSRSSRNVSS